MKTHSGIWIAVFLGVVTPPVLANEKGPAGAPPALFTALSECRTVTEDAARLSCYDLATSKIEAALSRNELYVVDQKQVRDTRKTLFGLPLPDLGLFGGDAEDKNRVTEVELVVRSAQSTPDGWRMMMEDGSVWAQTDGQMLGRGPSPGTKVVVKHGSLGSFKASVGGQPSVKVKRLA